MTVKPRPKPTSEQPLRAVMSRGRRGHDSTRWAVLECGHEEPCTDRPMATHLRCTTCLPVRRPLAPPLPPQHDEWGQPR